jgi:ribosomal protein L29
VLSADCLSPLLCPRRARRKAYATSDALLAEVQNCKEEMFRWRIKFAKADDWKPAEYRRLKKRVATLLTIKRERELAAGELPDKRAARVAEQRKLVEAGLGQF